MWHALLYVLAYHAVGILVYGHLEDWGPLDTSYFLTVTATTVGYGDLTPSSDAGKAFTVVYALLGVFLVFDVLTSLFADVVKNTAWREGLLDWCTPGVSLRARRVDTNDPTLTVDEVNRRVDYSLRYALAFVPPVVCLLLGIIVGHVSDVQAGEARDGLWLDSVYWSVITMSTVGYGDLSPQTKLGKALALVYLPLAVFALADAVADASMIRTRRKIRETSHAHRAHELLLAEAAGRAGDPNETLTEAEFLVAVLLDHGLVDEQALSAIRRQFRHLTQGSDPPSIRAAGRRHPPPLTAEKLFRALRATTTPSEAAAAAAAAAASKPGADGGYAEWFEAHWSPSVAAQYGAVNKGKNVEMAPAMAPAAAPPGWVQRVLSSSSASKLL